MVEIQITGLTVLPLAEAQAVLVQQVREQMQGHLLEVWV
jgi:hypothetical protein